MSRLSDAKDVINIFLFEGNLIVKLYFKKQDVGFFVSRAPVEEILFSFRIFYPLIRFKAAVLCWNHTHAVRKCYSDTNRLMLYNMKRIIYANLLHQELLSKIHIFSSSISTSDGVVHACELPIYTIFIRTRSAVMRGKRSSWHRLWQPGDVEDTKPRRVL